MISGVVFDLDGTLIDSWAVHRRCLRQAVIEVGVAEPSAARIAAAQRPTDVETLEILVGGARLDAAARIYGRVLRQAVAEAPLPTMPGAAAILDQLRDRGLAVGVCTGRSREDAQALLAASGLAIGLTVAREDTLRPKPAPDGLLRALRLLGLTAPEALYVGDSGTDASQGRAAGVRTLLLRPRGELAQLLDLAAVLGERRADECAEPL